jgi:hypothetical protein
MICNTDTDLGLLDLIFVWIFTNEKTNIENDYYAALQLCTRVMTWESYAMHCWPILLILLIISS